MWNHFNGRRRYNSNHLDSSSTWILPPAPLLYYFIFLMYVNAVHKKKYWRFKKVSKLEFTPTPVKKLLASAMCERDGWMFRLRMILDTSPNITAGNWGGTTRFLAIFKVSSFCWTKDLFVKTLVWPIVRRISSQWEFFIQRALCFDCSKALMVACNCSITHTNVHSLPLSQQKHCISIFFSAVDLIVTVSASQPIEWVLSDPGNRENNAIFMSGDISSPPHYPGTVINGSFCPDNHERTCHLSVSANWLFTTFQHRQTDTFLIVLSLSSSLTPQYKSTR